MLIKIPSDGCTRIPLDRLHVKTWTEKGTVPAMAGWLNEVNDMHEPFIPLN